MQDAIKMINNPEKQCLAASWGRQAGEHTAPACPLLGRDCLPDIDVGSTILPGSSGQRGKVIGKPTFKMWVFLCLPGCMKAQQSRITMLMRISLGGG